MPPLRSWSACGGRCAGRVRSRTTACSRSCCWISAVARSASCCTWSAGVSGRTITRRWRISCCSCVSDVGLAACAKTVAGTSIPIRAMTAVTRPLIGDSLPTLHPLDARPPTSGFGHVGIRRLQPSCRRLAAQADVVWQLVDVVGPAREEAREGGADLRDGADHGATDGARAEPLDHPIAHARPVVVAHAGVDALVADNRQLAVLDREVDEDAGAVGGAVHAERREDVTRALHGIAGAPAQAMRDAALDVDADLGRRAALRLAHRGRDGVEIGLGEGAAGPAGGGPEHPHSPPPPPPPRPPPPPPPQPPPPAPRPP